ncbi:MAG: amidohydrolase family protein [Candidatus Hydrogenedentes bacterium]|nr:amidohydrolase family protein [Candidatus Hydrogenedentota bacterium]
MTERLKRKRRLPELTEIPNFCSHEHWGSIRSIGHVSEGFRADVECGAVPHGETGVWDILLDPYFRGCLGSAGIDPDEPARRAGRSDFFAWAKEAPEAARRALWPALQQQSFTGTYQSIRRGIIALYGADLANDSPQEWGTADTGIARNYQKPFHWYQNVMTRSHFSALVRPVHPEYYVREDSPETAREERIFTKTVMRIDPLLDLWADESPRRAGLAGIAGIDPKDGESWRAFIAKLFELAGIRGAVGIKQLQAYRRDLDFQPRADSEVVWRGQLTPEQKRVFQDWVVHECCRQADALQWPHQIHVGTHNLPVSSPLPLGPLAQKYRQMKIVMLHCWPFLIETGWLAKYHPNVYIDSCWQPILNPAFYREAMSTWLNYVPLHKIMCGHDATSVEMAVGSSLFTREILTEVLTENAGRLGMGSVHISRVATDLLHNNAAAVYPMAA